MREPPGELSDTDVLAAVRSDWDATVSGVEHLAVGFGAHHWRAVADGEARFFVTYDRVGRRHSLDSLAGAYEGAITLAAAGLEFVVAPVRTRRGRTLVPIGEGALSCTPWLDGDVVGDGPVSDDATATANLDDLRRLHRAVPSAGIRRWAPLVDDDLLAQLADAVGHPWDGGPYGERARHAVRAALPAVQAWTRRYTTCVTAAKQHPWVPTHGETHTRNQLRTTDGIRFVDWESLLLAPRERDLSTLVQAGFGAESGADPTMVELFDLEWRLDEIDQYARWLAAAHHGTADDTIAYEGLLDELHRTDWWPAG